MEEEEKGWERRVKGWEKRKGDPGSTHLGHDLVQLRLGYVEEVLEEVASIQKEVVLDRL